MSDAPCVSLIVRSMGRPCLADALASVALQRHRPLELIVVDATGGAHPPLPPLPLVDVRLLDLGRPLNRPAAANAGLVAARGEWVGFLDDDDFLEPTHVDRLVARAHAADRPTLVYAQHWGLDRFQRVALRRHHGFNPLILHHYCQIFGMSCLLHRSLIDAGHRLDETLDTSEDWDFWLRLLPHAGFATLDAPTHFFGLEAGTSGTGRGRNSAGRERHLVFHDRVKARYAEAGKSAWSAYFERLEAGIALQRDGDLDGALACFAALQLEYPSEPNARFLIGNVYADLGQLHAARTRYREAIFYNGDAAQYHFALGAVCERIGDDVEAREAYAAAARHAPAMANDAAARIGRIDARTPRAVQVGRNAACPCGSGLRYKACHGRAASDPAARGSATRRRELHDAALAAFRGGDIQRARREYDLLVASDPADVEALHARALLALDLGRLDDAQSDIDRALRLSPADAQIADNRTGIAIAVHERRQRELAAVELDALAYRHTDPARLRPATAGAALHIVCAFEGDAEHNDAARVLARLLADGAPVTVWSALPGGPADARRLDPARRDVPSSGTLVFLGARQPAPSWLTGLCFERLIVVQTDDDTAAVLDLTRALHARTAQPILHVAADARGGDPFVPGVCLVDVDLRGHGPRVAAPRDGRAFVVGRASANDHRLFHPADAAFFRARATRGDQVRVLGGTVLMRHFMPSHPREGIALLPDDADDFAGFLRELDCVFFRASAASGRAGARLVAAALACGLPIVCARRGGLAELVSHGSNGFLFDADDDDAAHACLDRLRADPALARMMGHAARATAERAFGSDRRRRAVECFTGRVAVAA
ncbi:MAG: tetratricopeptide repeat protein [Betaproteobacteria bacterium]